ncbi:methyltransferase family protein [Breoghania corrubedonensis]|uniref:Methyltransferase family protein n=1 Tax=Breoghania corrubedonensis TaxID=665038 RepID=A0A2T5V7V0_9HYPH|nr:rhodoquinone biosynthesis methyltransferase RquA [Breoghania corrubedonensis]PTW59820.1 methyltransferase family protein [Breoghania corrubedonensis]
MSEICEDAPYTAGRSADESVPASTPAVPDYMREIYDWAYINPRLVPLLDRQIVVQAILWGNANRLVKTAVDEFSPGQSILQPAHVYGRLCAELASRVGPAGRLEVRDVTPIQVARARAKLAGHTNAIVIHADSARPFDRKYDGVCCFFLLHEVPDDYKTKIVNNVLDATGPGGKAVFVDYHQWRWFHPMGPIMWFVFRYLEPLAPSLCASEIREFAGDADGFTWTKQTFFGGLYQKVVAVRK